jgi:hypothetical protein
LRARPARPPPHLQPSPPRVRAPPRARAPPPRARTPPRCALAPPRPAPPLSLTAWWRAPLRPPQAMVLLHRSRLR